MAKPAGVLSNMKDNSKKKYREREEWMAAKKLGRKPQRWVWDVQHANLGHWEKGAL